MPRRHLFATIRSLALAALALAGPGAASAQTVPAAQPPPFAQPASIGDGWERAEPAASGFDAARLREALEGLMGGGFNLHSVIVERHGRLVAELYQRGKDKGVYSLFASTRDFGPTTLHDTRSVGKSVIDLLLGVAQKQGKLDSLSKPVLDFFPECADLATPQLRAITLEHLLTMSGGWQWQEGGPGRDDEHRLYWKSDPPRYVLSRPIVAPPGKAFVYNSGGTLLLADVLERATATPLKDYARRELFEPLGITDWEWTGDLHGRPMAFTGLRLRPRDMAKLGRLVLDHGQWKGRQLVPAEWIAASLEPRLDTGFDGLRYGHFWWTGTVPRQGRELPWAAAFGNGSQRIFVVPDLDLCVVTTAGAYGDLPTLRHVQAGFAAIVGAAQELGRAFFNRDAQDGQDADPFLGPAGRRAEARGKPRGPRVHYALPTL